MLVKQKIKHKKTVRGNRLMFLITGVLLLTLFYFSNFALAQDQYQQGIQDLILPGIGITIGATEMVVKIINIILGVLGLIGVILIIYGGFIWMTSNGNPQRVEKAKKIIINTLIGLVVVLLSFLIVKMVMGFVYDWASGRDSGSGSGFDSDHGPGLPQNIFRVTSIVTSCGNPSEYTQDVYRCSGVVVNFNHSVNTQTVETAVNGGGLRIEDCGSDISCSTPSTPAPFLDPQSYAGSSPNGNGSEWTARDRSVSFTHQELFAANNYYRLIIPKTLADQGGLLIDPGRGCGSALNPVPGCVDAGNEYRWTFRTGTALDDISPAVTAVYPADQMDLNYPDRNVNLKPILWVRFSEAIAPWSVNDSSLRIRQVQNVDPNNPDSSGIANATPIDSSNYSVAINSQGTGLEIYFKDDFLLEPFSWYQIEVNGVTDLCNNLMEPKDAWRFETNDRAPGVSQVYPRNDYQKACPDTAVLVVFNTSMYNPANDSCEVLPAGGGYVVGGSFVPDVPNRYLRVIDNYPGPPADPNDYCQEYEFVPISANLNPGATYSVGVNTNLVINKNGEFLNYGDMPPADSPSLGEWHFVVAPTEECANQPVITRVSPELGTDGVCLTVFGRYFDPDNNGQGAADKITFAGQTMDIDPSAWTDTQIATSLPSPSGLTPGNYPIQVNVDHPAPIGTLSSNEYGFRLMAGQPSRGPCLWSIRPGRGCGGDAATLNGIRFGPDPGTGNRSTVLDNVTFSDGSLRASDNDIDSWNDKKIILSVPSGVVDGAVKVTVSGNLSNPVYFDASCGEGALCFSDINACASGNANCQDGYECVASGTDCRCQRDNTGENGEKHLKVVRVNECDPNPPTGDPILPSPNPQPDAQWVCLNAQISARFNEQLNPNSVNENTFIVEQCSDLTESGCQAWVNVAGNRRVFDYPNQHGGILFTPASDFSPSTLYRVTVTTGVLSLFDRSLLKDYTWQFATRSAGGGSCPIENVVVEPSSALLNYVGATQDYLAVPYANQKNGCAVLTGNYVWAWSSSQVNVADINTALTSNINTAVAADEGATQIEATAEQKTGRVNLRVSFGECGSDADCNACQGSTCDMDTFKCTPSITGLGPRSGPVGRWVTLQGCYFENFQGNGQVTFSANPVVNYPCSQSWSDSQVLVEVPALPSGVNYNNGIANIQLTTNSNLASNLMEFNVVDSCGTITDPLKIPGLCRINPSFGQENSLISLSGENLTSDPANNDGGIFFNDGILPASEWDNWAATAVHGVRVPSGVNSGLVNLEVNSCPSNSLYFAAVGVSCDGDGDTDNDMCIIDQSMCGRGLVCDNDDTSATYCTCQLPSEALPSSEVIIVDNQPTDSSTEMCLNLAVNVLFNQPMKYSTLNRQTIKMWSVDSQELGPKCVKETALNNKAENNLVKRMSNKILVWLKKVFGKSAAAQQNRTLCPVEAGIKSYQVDQGIDGCPDKNGCTRTVITPLDPLKADYKYAVQISGGNDGVKSSQGGIMSADYEWGFSMTTNAQICKIDKVEIIPERFTFTQTDQTQEFIATAYSQDGQALNSDNRVYPFSWQWHKDDTDEIIKDVNSVSDRQDVVSQNKNGQATVYATASSTNASLSQDWWSKENSSANITNFLCENPVIIEDTRPSSHYLTMYCRGNAGDMLLPDANQVETPDNQLDGDALLVERFVVLKNADDTPTGDAVGIRVYANPDRLSAEEWYNQKVPNSDERPSKMKVAGYDAVRVGRTVYVAATNINGQNAYPNIYLMSYNNKASSQTVNIFNQMVDNWQFNENLAVEEQAQVVRDTQRINDLGDIKSYLAEYYAKNNSYPTLQAGSYEQGHSTSVWPSWQQALGAALGKALPIDPINRFAHHCQTNINRNCWENTDCQYCKQNINLSCINNNSCPGDENMCANDACLTDCPAGFDPVSCWNDMSKEFKCPNDSYIYQYKASADGTSFVLYGNIEYDNVDWSGIEDGIIHHKNDNTCQEVEARL